MKIPSMKCFCSRIEIKSRIAASRYRRPDLFRNFRSPGTSHRNRKIPVDACPQPDVGLCDEAVIEHYILVVERTFLPVDTTVREAYSALHPLILVRLASTFHLSSKLFVTSPSLH